ncbi:MAG: hypothetical protein LQ344_008016 [Seirophora lacunosa]|nr:MAG: hypothetical protein LQ344_008016 [Seirophora lacunosa]
MPSVRNTNWARNAKRYSSRGDDYCSSTSSSSCRSIDRYYPKTDSYRPSSTDDSSSSSGNGSFRYYSLSSSSDSCSRVSSSSSRYAPYAYRKAACSSFSERYSSSSQESALDYYTRTAPRKYNRRISRHTGIVADRHTACAATLPGQKTCMHVSTTAGDIVNYIPMGNLHDVPGDAPVPAKLSMHFMVLLPKYYKPIQLQSSRAHHAALVITKNPIGASTLLAPQPHSDVYKATNVPYFQTLPFDAHSARRRVVVDEAVEGRWVWKANTSVGYQVKIVHQDNLHAVIYPGHPTVGLRLSDGAFEQVLGNLGEEDEELEYMRLVRNVEFWGEADSSRGRRKPSHCVDDAAGAADARSSCGD